MCFTKRLLHTKLKCSGLIICGRKKSKLKKKSGVGLHGSYLESKSVGDRERANKYFK